MADNRIGFPPETAEKIFTIFQRLHSSGYEAICPALYKKAAGHHNGRSFAESTEGEGAKFTVNKQQ